MPVGKNQTSLDNSGKSSLLLPFFHLQKNPSLKDSNKTSNICDLLITSYDYCKPL